MSMRNILFCALIGLGPITLPVIAAVNINIDIIVAPPPQRYEAIPAPRSGYAWAPGYWRWENERHVWSQGRWIAARSGSDWVADRWEPRDGRYYYERGHWKENGKLKKAKKEKHEGRGDEHGKGWAKGQDR